MRVLLGQISTNERVCAVGLPEGDRHLEEIYMRSILKWVKRETGQSIILVAISIAMLCGVAALVVDVGMVSVSQGQLQNAADAAALAAARDLPTALKSSAKRRSTIRLRASSGSTARW